MLTNLDWSFIGQLPLDEAADCFTFAILRVCERWVPRKTIHEEKSKNAWVSQESRAALLLKHELKGSPGYKDACLKLSELLN